MKKVTFIAAIAAAVSIMLTGCGKKEEKKDYAMKIGNITVSQESYEFIKQSLEKNGVPEAELDKKADEEAEAMYQAIALGRAMKIEIDGTIATQQKNAMIKQGMPEQLAADLSEAQQFMTEIIKLAKKDLVEKDPSLLTAAKDGKWRAKHVLVLTKDVPEADLPAKKVLADEILAKAQAGEDFDALIEEYNEDPGVASNPNGYIFGAGEMVPEFEDGVKNTPIGEFTLVKTDYGYHIIQPLELTDEVAAEAVDMTNDQYIKFLEKKLKEYEIKTEK